MEIVLFIIGWYSIGLISTGYMEWWTTTGKWNKGNVEICLSMGFLGPFVAIVVGIALLVELYTYVAKKYSIPKTLLLLLDRIVPKRSTDDSS